VVAVLLAAKAEVNAKAASGQTALGLALANQHEEVAEVLRQHGGQL